MANTLHAGEKIHLRNYKVKLIDGRYKFFKSNDPHIDWIAACGIRHHYEDFSGWLRWNELAPERLCKKCQKKLKERMAEAKRNPGSMVL